jgi:23S rRNA (cytosine1962-C5)-methyltransferase
MSTAGPILSKLISSFELRSKYLSGRGTNCFRLFNSSADGIEGLTIDLYGEYLLMQFFDENLFADKNLLVEGSLGASAGMEICVKGVLLKKRTRLTTSKISAARKSSVVFGEPPPAGYTVIQNGVRAAVDLIEGQNTGIFLDMRVVRNRLLDYYGKTESMLNLFSYTSLFSIHGLMNGVRHAVNIDLSRQVLKKAVKNYEINGLSVDSRDFIYGDAIDWSRRIKKTGRRFSLIIYDPPTFSRGKKRTFSVRRHYSGHLDLLGGLSEGGYILTSINSPSISKDEYASMHPRGWKLEFLESEPDDFGDTGTPYLKAGLWQI